MRRKVIAGLSGWALLGTIVACNSLSKEECLQLRSEAYEIINEPHMCGEDADCNPSGWPGCAKPVSTKNQDRIAPIKEKFDKGSCEDDPQTCPDTPLMYCKQGLCVSKHQAGEAGNPSATGNATP